MRVELICPTSIPVWVWMKFWTKGLRREFCEELFDKKTVNAVEGNKKNLIKSVYLIFTWLIVVYLEYWQGFCQNFCRLHHIGWWLNPLRCIKLALDHQTGAVKNLTAGKKKNCFVTVKHKTLKENTIFFFFVTRLGLQYILRGESDMTLDVGQMTLCKKTGFMLHSIPNRKWYVLYFAGIWFSTKTYPSNQTLEEKLRYAIISIQLPKERVIHCV